MTMTTRRRALITAGVATAAVAAGVGGHVLQRRSAAADAADAASTEVWSLDFETPGPDRLAMASLRGKPLVLNFWATWCPPCVREMPALDRFAREHGARGWQVVGLAADNATAVRKFLAVTPVGFPIALAGFEGIELSRRLGNVSGGLPFTVVYGRDGQARHRHIGETRYEQLADWAKGFS
jgi:thiol-disulfide isomerase/thioredoxin